VSFHGTRTRRHAAWWVGAGRPAPPLGFMGIGVFGFQDQVDQVIPREPGEAVVIGSKELAAGSLVEKRPLRGAVELVRAIVPCHGHDAISLDRRVCRPVVLGLINLRRVVPTRAEQRGRPRQLPAGP
jgi:hypothetical protein